MSKLSKENLEVLINEHLKEDLAYYERHINQYNEDITEFVQLKNTIQTLSENCPDGFKTQMNIGANIFMEAKVDKYDKILVNIGKDHYLELNQEEAIKFCDFKIKILTNECDLLRKESIKKRVDIKLALMCIAEKDQLHEDANN